MLIALRSPAAVPSYFLRLLFQKWKKLMDPSEGRFYREAFPSLCDFYLQADHCETSFNLFLFLPLEDFSRFLPPCEDNESRNILRKLKRRNWHSFLLKSFDSSKYTFAYVEQCAWYFEWKCTKNAVGSNCDSTSRRYRKFGVWNGRVKSKSGTRTMQPWKKGACQVAPRWYLQASGHVHGVGFHSAVSSDACSKRPTGACEVKSDQCPIHSNSRLFSKSSLGLS